MTVIPMPRRAPPPNDPLAGKTAKQIFEDCIWASDEDTKTKILLLCISRFFDENARSSDMSYRQIAQECGFHEKTAMKTAKGIRGIEKGRRQWLRIEIGKGRRTASGPQNLYHGVTPEDVVEGIRSGRIRAEREKTITRAVDEAAANVTSQGVACGDVIDEGSPQTTPLNDEGSPTTTPQGSPDATPYGRGRPGLPEGSPEATHTASTAKEREEVVDARARDRLVRVEDEPEPRSSLTNDVVAFIARHANVDATTARTMLANNAQIYGSDNIAEAYAQTVSRMATGIVAKPYPYLLKTAGELKKDRASPGRQRGPTSKSAIFDSFIKHQE